ncbi:uncharacterized protein MYCFIDRAFT_60119 [Pseudocercospora fijiensis CIRAD86]|uniref:Uncharacterized protein n=1 Tax=Pseudocercospora fijiensis (strain CIRAD86) TaxID=383855 RepID=M3AJF9_PSEFD|nr:uncharacterized protein MYCFIDRAFT_60119 [Pseudocercospora fijiensis CIRAD86]EME77293.1 hypothetical protein MYCFIDRAFT_60119 [Pseudocercospora fijiensis CIRAD86]
MALAEAPRGPYRLVTVNTAPDRAKRLIGRLVDALKDKYEIKHVANCERVDEVERAVTDQQPELLFCASMWTSEEAAEIQTIAKNVKPDVATYAIPYGMQVQEGPDRVVEHLTCMVPQVLELHFGVSKG